MRPEFHAALEQAAQQHGTPLYAYDWHEIATRANSITAAFGTQPIRTRVYYAMKANPNLNLLTRIREQFGFGFEACSGGELERAIRAGAAHQDIVLHGPGKLDGDLARAHFVGATIMIDATHEIDRIARHAPNARVMIRVNPGLAVSTHDHLATGNANSKFGIPAQDVPNAVQQAERAGLSVHGLHMHIGSAIENPNDYSQALERVAALASTIGPRPAFNMGGGFGLQFNLAPLATLGTQAAQAFQAQELWLEPGRWLVATAGVLLVRVLGLKRTARDYACIDAGMSELLRPMLYNAKHQVVSLARRSNTKTLDLAGPACESGDVIARDVTLPEPHVGDTLAILEAGAYGASMSNNYLTRPRPPEVLLENNEWVLMRRSETMQELLQSEMV